MLNSNQAVLEENLYGSSYYGNREARQTKTKLISKLLLLSFLNFILAIFESFYRTCFCLTIFDDSVVKNNY